MVPPHLAQPHGVLQAEHVQIVKQDALLATWMRFWVNLPSTTALTLSQCDSRSQTSSQKGKRPGLRTLKTACTNRKHCERWVWHCTWGAVGDPGCTAGVSQYMNSRTGSLDRAGVQQQAMVQVGGRDLQRWDIIVISSYTCITMFSPLLSFFLDSGNLKHTRAQDARPVGKTNVLYKCRPAKG